MSQILDDVGRLEVLHADQTPRYTIIPHATEEGKFWGVLNWREFSVTIECACASRDEVRAALAKRALELYENSKQYPLLPVRIDAKAEAAACIDAKDVLEAQEKAEFDAEETLAAHAKTNAKAPLEAHAVEASPAQLRAFCLVGRLDRHKEDGAGVYVKFKDGREMFLDVSYAAPLMTKLGAKLTIRAALNDDSIAQYIDVNAPFIVRFRPVKRLGNALLCGVIEPFIPYSRTAPRPGKVLLDNPAIKQFLSKRNTVFYMTSDLLVPTDAANQRPSRRAKAAARAKKEPAAPASQSEPATQQPEPAALTPQEPEHAELVVWY